MSRKGIDVSDHQGKIDWEKVKADGVEFAIIRMGVGSDYKNQDDKKVLENAKACDRLGIPYGLYLYSYALNESQAHSEAQHMIRIARQTNASLGYFYDMEDADSYKAKHGLEPRWHKTELTNFCKIFMQDLNVAGIQNVGVYANYDYFKNILNLAELRKYGKIWLAHWGIGEPSLECNIWQYTSKGKVNGISGNVDMNIGYFDSKEEITNNAAKKSIDELAQEVMDGKWGNDPERKKRLADAGYDPKAVQSRVNEIYKSKKENQKEYYMVVKGDTLSAIAKKYNITVSNLVELNKIPDPNKIYAGQKIRVK